MKMQNTLSSSLNELTEIICAFLCYFDPWLERGWYQKQEVKSMKSIPQMMCKWRQQMVREEGQLGKLASDQMEKGILKIPNTHQHSQLISSYTHNSSADFPCKIIGHKVYQVLFILSMNWAVPG